MSSFAWAKISARFAQGLIGLPKLAVLLLQGIQPFGDLGRNASARSFCAVQPILCAVEEIAARRAGCSPLSSNTMPHRPGTALIVDASPSDHPSSA